MKKSDDLISPTSPASFLKKQSHIITNNGSNQQFFPLTPSTRNELQNKQMHRSHFHTEVNSNKLLDDEYFDHHDLDLLDIYSQGKQKMNEQDKTNKPNKQERQQFQSFYQSQEMSSQHQNSQTKSQKKFILSANTLSQKIIKRVSSNHEDDKFLFINSKKQKYSNNYFFISDSNTLKQEIKKYQISIQKLKQQNYRLRSQKIKLSSTNQSMQLIESRLQLQSIKKRIRQLETEKEMHLTINMNKDKEQKHSTQSFIQIHSGGINNMTASCLETHSKKTDREGLPKRNMPTFRATQEKQSQPLQTLPKGALSPKNKFFRGDNPNQNYKILQNMKSPYFLKKN